MSFQEFWKSQLEESRKNKKNTVIVPQRPKVIGSIDGYSSNKSPGNNVRSTLIKPGDALPTGPT